MFIRSLKLNNILSFRDPPRLKLEPLNIFIGANGSGKSNLIDCFGLLHALPGSVSQYINDRGGADLWAWRGATQNSHPTGLECEFETTGGVLDYLVQFSSFEHQLTVGTEQLCNDSPKLLLARSAGRLMIPGLAMDVQPHVSTSESMLAAYRNPAGPVEITNAQEAFSGIRIYRGFETGTRADARVGVASSGPKHPIESDGSNLALALQEMDFHGSLKSVNEYLSKLTTRFEEIKIRLEGGRAQFYLRERGIGLTSAIRLSDGTLKFLCLMAVLLDHDPAPLVCIEEPETGLHPEALAVVGDALRDASRRMQLIVTTHSDALVDRFTDEPESVIVCEKGLDESTAFQRLSKERLKEWLSEYTLGDLWRRGEIGAAQE